MAVSTDQTVTGLPGNPVLLTELPAAPAARADTGFVYTKDVAGVTELFYQDSGGSEVQVTSGGALGGVLPPASVSFAEIQDIATDRLLGRDTAGTGDIEEIAVSGGLEFTGTQAIQTSAFTGDVTKAAGGTALTIAADAVTFAKFQNITSDRLLGRDTAASGDVEELTATGGIEFTGTGIQTSAFTGDVTKASGGTALTIATAAVTLAKMADIATDRLIGRDTAGTGVPEALTVGGGVEFTGAVGIQTSAFTGDVTKTAGGTALTIAADAVTFAKFQNITTDRLLGRDTAASGDVEELTVGGGVEFTGTGIQRSALTGDVTASAGSGATTIPANTVTYAKMQDISATSRFLGRITGGAGDTEELTGTQATTLLDTFTDALKGLAPASGGGTTNFLRADGTWTAPAATSSGWQDDGTIVRLMTTTDNANFGGTTDLGKVTVQGDADEIQLRVRGFSTQTANPVTFENSAASALWTLSNAGNTNQAGTFSIASTTVFEADRDLAITLLPSADDTLDLGSATRRFNELYCTYSVFDRRLLYADQMDNPVNANWIINALAPVEADPTNNAFSVRSFDDTTEEGAGFILSVPAGATKIKLYFKGRARTAPGAARTVGLKLYYRQIYDNAAISTTWAGANDGSKVLTDIDITTNAFFQYDSQTLDLITDFAPDIILNKLYQFELTRINPVAGTELVGDYLLAELVVEFS